MQKGGVYSTVRIPFAKNLRATLSSAQNTTGKFFFIIRGIEAYPVQIGDLQLPATARLRLHRTKQIVQAQQLVTLANVSAGTSGAVLSVKFDASSSGGFGYLEACMRAVIDGAEAPLFLSSGAEDVRPMPWLLMRVYIFWQK